MRRITTRCSLPRIWVVRSRRPSAIPGDRHIYNQYVIRVPRRDALRKHLEAQGVGTEIYYPLSLHEQRCFAYLGHEPGDFPNAHEAAAEVLALPIYPELSAEQREYVVHNISSFFG